MNLAKEKLKTRTGILWYVMLLVFLCLCYIVTTYILWQEALDGCYDQMEMSVDQASATLIHHLETNLEKMEIITRVLPYDIVVEQDLVELELDMFSGSRHINALCIQLPDGELITGGSKCPDFSALPEFSAQPGAIPTISGRFPGKEGSGKHFIYQSIPILHGEETAGILYAFMDLSIMPECFISDLAYDGNSELYLVDGDTGDFLMDTWHERLGNIYDGSMGIRETKPGYDHQTMIDGIRNGDSGYYVFVSRTVGEYFYTRYQPVGINNWSIQMTVLESVAFAEAMENSRIIIALGAAVTLITSVYLFLILRQYRSRLAQQKEDADRTAYMLDVQQTLFNAYRIPNMITNALKKVADAVGAEGAQLISLQNSWFVYVPSWRRPDATFREAAAGENLERDFYWAFERLKQNQSILFHIDQNIQKLTAEELEVFCSRSIHSLMLTPILDSEGVLQGILCATNLQKKKNDCIYLECVAHSFMMAIQGREDYQTVQDMGVIDVLTGLNNRNSYEKALPSYANVDSKELHCIYIDVNGLHEFNNQYGHAAGDAMLCCVSDTIRKIFGSGHSYRIGGDEFVIFSTDEAAIVHEQCAKMSQMIEVAGYHISVGIAAQPGDSIHLQTLLTSAEETMYMEKRAFYERNDRRSRRRDANRTLEEHLKEKKDTEGFLELVSSYFKGVYVINTKTDSLRSIYIPGYFARTLEESGHSYSKAFRQYIEELVDPEYHKMLLSFCDYVWLNRTIEKEHSIRCTYRKLDDTLISLRIFPAKNFSSHEPETYWIFEENGNGGVDSNIYT